MPGYRLHNLSSSCSKSFLTTIAQYGNQILSLFDIINTGLQEEEDSAFTYINFLMTLKDILITAIFKPTLQKTNLNGQMSIMNYLDYLNCPDSGFMLCKVNFLHEITKNLNNNPRLAAYLLDNLQSYLSLDDVYCCWIVTQLFLSALRPSLNYIEKLLTNGENIDPHGEFFFNIDTKLNPDNFWTNCIEVRSGCLPRFFEPCLDKLLVGIKSRLIIKMFNKHKSFKESAFPKLSLFKVFFDELRKFVPENEYTKMDTPSTDNNNSNTNSTNTTASDLRLRLEQPIDIVPQNYNYWSAENLINSSLQDYNFDKLPEYSFEYLLPPTNELTAGIPIKLVLQKSLNASIDAFIEPIDTWLMAYIRSKFTKHLIIFNNYFLLQKSTISLSQYFDFLFEDITGVDDIIQNHILWQSYTFPDDDVKAFVSYVREERKLTNLTVLDNLHLIYEQTDKISRTIVNVDSRGVYDGAFQMLTHVMYARWILQNLKLPLARVTRNHPEVNKNSYAAFHRLCIIRHHLLFITNNLYHFMMNNIQDNVSKLYSNNTTATDCHKLRKNFNRFITRIMLITLQTNEENVRIVRKLIRSLIKICIELDRMWRKGTYTLAEVCEFEERSNVENIEKALKIFYYKCFIDIS